MRKYPVTNGEYLRFLNSLVQRGEEERAHACLPKEHQIYRAQKRQTSAFQRSKSGLYILGPDKDGDCWHARWPVMMIDYQTANQYIIAHAHIAAG